VAKKSKAAVEQSSEQSEAGLRVRATRLGIYGHTRRRPGDTFTLAPGETPSSWMEVIDDTPEPEAAD
jgi:hypothetical protein